MSMDVPQTTVTALSAPVQLGNGAEGEEGPSTDAEVLGFHLLRLVSSWGAPIMAL